MFIKSFAKVVIFMQICNTQHALFINLLEPNVVITVVIIYALIYLASMICLKWPIQMPNYQGSPKAIDGEGTKAPEAINISI